MPASRVYQKITSPIHRSTAYDFNVHLDHASLHRPGHRISNTPEGDLDEMGVQEHEIVVRVKGADNQYNNGRLRVFSALNNLLLQPRMISKLEQDNRGFWNPNGQSTVDTITQLQSGKYRNNDATDANYDEASASLNNVLHQFLEYVGVAITPQKLFPRDSRQDPQGFACTRGGLNTIHNTGSKRIHAGDQIVVNFAMPNVIGRRLLMNPSHYASGTPHNKIVTQVEPDTPPENNDDFLNHVLNQMRNNREPQDPDGNSDALVPFSNQTLPQNRPNAFLMHRRNVQRNLHDGAGGEVLRRCSLDVVNLTMLWQGQSFAAGILDRPFNPFRTGAYLPPMFVRLTSADERLRLVQELSQLGLNAASGRIVSVAAGRNAAQHNLLERFLFLFVDDDIGVPVVPRGPRFRIDATRDFENCWVWQPRQPLRACNITDVFGNANSATGTRNLVGGGGQVLTTNIDPLYSANNPAERASNYLINGDSLTYILEMMHDSRHGRNPPGGNQNNRLIGRHAPIVELVRTVVRETLIAQRHRSRRTIGMALSGAQPGEPFDIVLSDS